MRFSNTTMLVLAVCGAIFISPSSRGQEPIDEVMMGTWTAKGVSETECFVSDATITLRVFERVDEGRYRATYVERGELTVKDECREQVETDPGERVPIELGGAIVTVDIDSDNATIWSDNPNFHTEDLNLQGSRMVGADELGGIQYVKAFPEIRYDVREGAVGWNAIRYTRSDVEQTALEVISEFAIMDAFVKSFQELLESAIREAMEDEDMPSEIERSREYNHLERFDGMTFEEIVDGTLPDVSEYLTKKIASAREALAECEECPEDELRELREELAERKEQRDAMLEIQRARQ